MKIVTRKLIAGAGAVFLFAGMLFAASETERPVLLPQTEVYSSGIPLLDRVPPQFPQGGSELDDLGYVTELYSWDFENGDPWTPRYRHGSVLPGGTYWHVDSYAGYSGTNSWWCGVNAPTISYNGYANNWLQYLETPALDLTTSGTVLTFQFQMRLYAEGTAYHPAFDSWDGANVWYSIDGGATWAVLANPSQGYNSSSNYAFGEGYGYYYDNGTGTYVGTPVPVWQGNMTGGNYVPVAFDISSMINETNVKFRFGFASDASESAQNYSAYTGMFLDEISIVDNVGGTFLSNNADGVALPSDLVPIEQIEPEWVLTENSANSETHSWMIESIPEKNARHGLDSPAFHVPSGLPVYMSYHVWCDMPDVDGLENGVLEDSYRILISINNGASWYHLLDDWSTRNDFAGESLSGWVYRNSGYDNATKLIDLTQYAGYNVKIRFEVIRDHNDDGGLGTGLYIDDVSVFQYEGFYNYMWEPAEYNWVELADDPEAQFIPFDNSAQYAHIDIVSAHGFQFPYFGDLLNYIKVGASGVLFENGGNEGSIPGDMHQWAQRSGVIAPLWTYMDYMSRDNAGVYVKNVEGVLVFEWFMSHLQNQPDWPLAFQAHLFPDGVIEYHYQVVPDFLGNANPVNIGLNDRSRTHVVELRPEMDFLPTNEMAVRLVPGMPEYGGLELTVIDEDTNLPVPDLPLFIPEFNQQATTDANGVVLFDRIPVHYTPAITIELLTDFYVHQRIGVEIVPEVLTQETMYVRTLMNPIIHVDTDNNYEDAVYLSWERPDNSYQNVDLSVFNDTQGRYWYNFPENTAQGMDFSMFEMQGVFDILGVNVFLQNRHGYWYDYMHRPPIRLDVWDMVDPENPVHMMDKMYQLNNTNGWFQLPIGMLGLESPSIGITITTPGFDGDMAYNMFYDEHNGFDVDLIVHDIGTPDQTFMRGTMPGDPVMYLNVKHNGTFGIWDGEETLSECILAEQSTGPRAAGTIEKGARLFTRGIDPGVVNIAANSVSVPSSIFVDAQSSVDELDAFTDDIAYYNVYRDDVLIHSTSDGLEMGYMDTGLDETVEYSYEIASVYLYDGAEVIGPKSTPILVSPAMPPMRPDGTDGILVENATISGGDLTISWLAPTVNMDDTPIDDLDGYHVYMNGDFETLVADLADDVTTWSMTGIGRDYYNLYITAYDNAGNESYPWVYGYQMVGVADEVADFELDGREFSGDGFMWGASTAGPPTGFDGSVNLWGTNLNGYYENEMMYGLQSPPLHIGEAPAWVTFQHWYDFEYGYDGGLVVISTDNGVNWEIVDMPADGSLYQNPYWGGNYNNPVSSLTQEGKGVITGFSGDMYDADPEGWVMRGVNLDAYIGMDIILGFVAGTDAANNLYQGWFVDNVGLFNVVFSPVGSISGVVSDNSTSAPIENAIVMMQGRHVMTGVDGAYEFNNVLVGAHELTAWKEGYNDMTVTVDVTEDAVTTQAFLLLHPVLTPEVSEIVLDVFPGFVGHYALSITNDGDGPLGVWPNVVEPDMGMEMAPPTDESSMYSTPDYRDVSASGNTSDEMAKAADGISELDDYSRVLDSFWRPYTLDAMTGVALNHETGKLFLTGHENSGIHVYNPEAESVEHIIPTPYASADDPVSPFPGSVTFHGSDLWFSWHEWVETPEIDEMEGAFMTHIVRIIDFETGEYDVEFLSWDMGWFGPVSHFEFMPDYAGMILTGFNHNVGGQNVIGFTNAAWVEPDTWQTPQVTMLRQLPTHGARGVKMTPDGNLWIASRNHYEDGYAFLFEISMPDMHITAQIPIMADQYSVGGLDFDQEGNAIVVDRDHGYLFEVGFGHPFFSPQMSRYFFAPSTTSDIVYNVRIPHEIPIGETIELEALCFNNGLPSPVIIPVILHVNEPVFQHDMVFEAGWNLVSTDLMPLNPETELQLPNLFGDEVAAGNLVLVKDNQGNIYDPATMLNQIGDWDPLQGYKVNVVEPTMVSVVGHNIPEFTPIPVAEGWNMVSFLPDDPMYTWEALHSVQDILIIAKDGRGRFVLPEFGYNGIGAMRPGDGYQMKVTEDGELIYGHMPYPEEMVASTEQAKVPEHFISSIEITGKSFSMLFLEAEVDGIALKLGDEIGIFGEDGKLLASAVWCENGKVGVPVWADEAATEMREGASQGEALQVQVWLKDKNLTIPATLEFIAGERTFTNDGYMVASISGTLSSVIPETFFLSQNYPNPFNPSTTIQYGLPKDAFVELEIFNVLGQSVATVAKKQQQAGYYTIVWNGRADSGESVSSGTYFYRLRAGEFVQMHRMVVTK